MVPRPIGQDLPGCDRVELLDSVEEQEADVALRGGILEAQGVEVMWVLHVLQPADPGTRSPRPKRRDCSARALHAVVRSQRACGPRRRDRTPGRAPRTS